MDRPRDADECPICNTTLPVDTSVAEAHVANCVTTQLAKSSEPPKHLSSSEPEPGHRDDDRCPVCATLLSGDASTRELHVMTCIESETSKADMKKEKRLLANLVKKCAELPPQYENGSSSNGTGASSSAKPGLFAARKSQLYDDKKTSDYGQDVKGSMTMQEQEDREVSSLRKWFSSLGGDSKTKEKKEQDRISKADELMHQRWGPPGSPVYEMVMRYMVATRMEKHWEYLGQEHPRNFKKYLTKGYMEPIPTAWVQSRQLAYLYPEGSWWETPAEKRLYYLLNNGTMPDGSKHALLRPLNIVRDRNTIIRRGNARNATQRPLDPNKLAAYRSPGDIFQNDKQIKSHQYSDQVKNTVYEARTKALHELAEGIIHGTDHLETMLLLDVSGSMTWNPHNGVIGPDGVRRFHDQPSNIALVQHLVHRVLHHMIPRAQREHPTQIGIDTVTFSSYGNYVGKLSATNFQSDWYTKVRLGGGTQVMQGWQVVKNTYFKHQYDTYGHGRYDRVFGWQPTPGMPKLSLLVFLDGEANDMDEFELELLGETWAYVTIALVGMENCPHHHSHAIELERVARFNPHVGFFDVHGRVCERMVVEDLLSSVYPVDPPMYAEVLKPEYDLPADDLPAYVP